ncbi:MAG: LysE family transporter [Pseudomonadota bacterium]
MGIETLLSFVQVFAAAVWTPGPNNAMLAASGATFGFRATLPHLIGVAFGFAAMLFIVALGIGAVFERVPVLEPILRLAGVLLLLWVAWLIATMRPPGAAGGRQRPFTLTEAVLFQWVNPKAWAMTIALAGLFTAPETVLRDASILALLAALIGLTSASGWTGLGAALQRVLAAPGRLRIFNIAMATMILLGVGAILLEGGI